MGERQQGEERMEEDLVTLLTQALDLPWLPLYLTRYFEKKSRIIDQLLFYYDLFFSFFNLKFFFVL